MSKEAQKDEAPWDLVFSQAPVLLSSDLGQYRRNVIHQCSNCGVNICVPVYEVPSRVLLRVSPDKMAEAVRRINLPPHIYVYNPVIEKYVCPLCGNNLVTRPLPLIVEMPASQSGEASERAAE